VSLQGGLSIERMCLVAGVSRAGFYRHLLGLDPWDEEMLLWSEIQKIVLQHRLPANVTRAWDVRECEPTREARG